MQRFPREPPPGRHLIVGDFNLHHPLRDLAERVLHGSKELMEFMAR